MINKLEKEILDSLNIGVNRLFVTEWSKQIGCCRPVIYKYLKRLSDKGYIKPHSTESIAGGTRGDKQVITAIYKLKEYNMYDKLLEQMVHFSSIKKLNDLDNKILKEISFTPKEYCFAEFLSLVNTNASSFYKRVMKLSMIDILEYEFIRGKTKKHIDCTLKIKKIDLTERYNNKLKRYDLLHEILISMPDIKFIKENVSRERTKKYLHAPSDTNFFLIMEDIFWNNILFGDCGYGGGNSSFLYPYVTESDQTEEEIKKDLQEILIKDIERTISKK